MHRFSTALARPRQAWCMFSFCSYHAWRDKANNYRRNPPARGRCNHRNSNPMIGMKISL
jgi:hypothetical protein